MPYDWINSQKSNQNWLRKEGEKFLFPGGGTMFPKGVGAYVDLMQDLIPGMKDGTVRTAIDTGCGVISLSLSLCVSNCYWLTLSRYLTLCVHVYLNFFSLTMSTCLSIFILIATYLPTTISLFMSLSPDHHYLSLLISLITV